MATVQVLGCLIKQPMLLMDEKYKLCVEDFPERFHQILYGAIDNLIKSGVQDLNSISIDDYLSKFPRQYKVFCENKGIEYIENAIEFAQLENFDYYYNTFRKFGLLNQLQKKGFDTTIIYDPNIIDVDELTSMQREFDNLTVEDIFAKYELGISELKEEYTSSSESIGVQAASGMMALKEQYKEAPEMGMPFSSGIMTTIARGRRLKKFYLKSAPSGFGKTKMSLGDAIHISVPYFFDTNVKQWINTGYRAATLFITTELEIDEIQTMIMAYVSGVSEEHILDGRYDKEEEERVDKAIEYINNSPLYIEQIPNFDIEDIENIIKKYKIKYQVGYVFFDYLFSSIKIMSEVAGKTKGVKLREDNVLLMFADRMKTLANVLNVHIDTSTQVNGEWRNAKEADMNLIRSAKSVADKVDLGIILLPVSEADKLGIETIVARNKGFLPDPNLVLHIYKNRRGKINHVRLFIYFDYSTCRTTDLFVTDNKYNLIDVESTIVEFQRDYEEDIDYIEEPVNEPVIETVQETPEKIQEQSGLDWF